MNLENIDLNKYIETRNKEISDLKSNFELPETLRITSTISKKQIELIFDTYAERELKEEIGLVSILGGESKLIEFSNSNLKTGLSEM